MGFILKGKRRSAPPVFLFFVPYCFLFSSPYCCYLKAQFIGRFFIVYLHCDVNFHYTLACILSKSFPLRVWNGVGRFSFFQPSASFTFMSWSPFWLFWYLTSIYVWKFLTDRNLLLFEALKPKHNAATILASSICYGCCPLSYLYVLLAFVAATVTWERRGELWSAT